VPAPTTLSDYLSLVHKSGLVAEEAFTTYVGGLGPEELALDPPQLAARMTLDGIITHFQAEQFLLGKCRGMILGNYKVLERLGSGGMALVYLCEHLHMKRRVAIKVLPTVNAQKTEYLKRFYREARANAVLDHPNIVRTYDIAQDDHNRHYLVMEYIDGALLQEIVKRFGPMPVERAAHYIRQAAIGLQHIHEAGLVHRDIKPDNLIVDRQGTVKILDLGLARFCQESEEILTQGILGTPDYLAPEQSQDSHHVDIRADIYSLGGTMYYLLTGNPPFGAGTVAQKLIWHQTKAPRSIRAQRADVPGELELVVATMLAKSPEYRFQTPADVAIALEPWTEQSIALPAEAELPRVAPRAWGSVDTASDFCITPMFPPTSRGPGSGPTATGAELLNGGKRPTHDELTDSE
jgi:serine/threonine protein kinase